MELPPKAGAVVALPFPFSDLSNSKIRPAVLIANAGKDDWICAQITSKDYSSSAAIALEESDFSEGKLRVRSFIRPGRLFTANQSLFRYQLALITENKLTQLLEKLIEVIDPEHLVKR